MHIYGLQTDLHHFQNKRPIYIYIFEDVFHIAMQRSVLDSRGRARAFAIHARTGTTPRTRSNTSKHEEPAARPEREKRARLRDPDTRRHSDARAIAIKQPQTWADACTPSSVPTLKYIREYLGWLVRLLSHKTLLPPRRSFHPPCSVPVISGLSSPSPSLFLFSPFSLAWALASALAPFLHSPTNGCFIVRDSRSHRLARIGAGLPRREHDEHKRAQRMVRWF